MPQTLAANSILRLALVLVGVLGTAAGIFGFLAGLKGTIPDLAGLACIPVSMASLVGIVLGATGGLWSPR
jgi:hypothetical protein